jgi:RNA-splicing ligase RtcB
MNNYEVIEGARLPIKAWTRGVQVEDAARQQLINLAGMPFIHKHVAAMPDVHWGMGAKSFIVRGKGNRESFCSCSHGAGRSMSRTEARKRFTIADHEAATHGVECRKDADVIDETPAAYKSIDAVMAAQSDLVDIVHTLKQIVCVKG